MIEIISRAESRKHRLSFFYTGDACRHGNVWLRSTAYGHCMCKECKHQRRMSSMKIGQGSVPWYGEWDDFVMREARDLCARRQDITGMVWQVDHMIPLKAKGVCGLHVANNIQVIPKALNAWKGRRMLLTSNGEWLTVA